MHPVLTINDHLTDNDNIDITIQDVKYGGFGTVIIGMSAPEYGLPSEKYAFKSYDWNRYG